MSSTGPQVSTKLDYQPQSLEGKAVVLSGGTTGIGRATALVLAAAGAKVLIYGRHEQELNDVLHDLKEVGEAYGMTADQSIETDVYRVFEEADYRLGGCDILINNAALSAKSVVNGHYTDWSYVVQTNLLGYMACTHEAIKRMQKTGGGHIVNIGSMSADVREEGSDIYVATKGAIQAFSEALRKQVNKEGIKVSLIEPGAVDTNLPEPSEAEIEKQREQVEKEEMLRAEDIAACVYYCLTQPPRCDVVRVQVRPHRQFI